MDFFEAQARARSRTGRLVGLFGVALAGLVAGLYVAARILADFVGGAGDGWWNARLFAGVAGGVLLLVGGSALWRWFALRAGGPAVAEAAGGEAVPSSTTDPSRRRLLNVVEEMALASGMPVPAVYVLPGERGINAFAAGYSTADAAVAVTEGALSRLSRDELQGVVAHEFSHILNGDMRLNTRIGVLVHGVLALSTVGRLLLRSLGRTRLTSGSTRREKGGGVGGVLLLLAAGLILLAAGAIGHLCGRIIQAAVSRQRELLADAAAVQFTRNPDGLAGALKKIGGLGLGSALDEPAAADVRHHCFAQAFRGSALSLFSTHPPLEARIRAIEPGWDGAFIAPRAESGADPTKARMPAPGAVLAATAAGISAERLVGDAGRPSGAAVEAGRAFLARLPESLREAARDPAQVAALYYATCLAPAHDPVARKAAIALIEERAGAAQAREVDALIGAVAALGPEGRLPLAQLAMPTLRELSPEACATLADTLDALIQADRRVTAHEFAMQKIVTRALGLLARPRSVLQQLAPAEVTEELALLLSNAARIEPSSDYSPEMLFARASASFTGLRPLVYTSQAANELERLDAALDRLALTPAPFRRRALVAAAEAIAADGRVSPAEAEWLRAIGAALDCPLPPVVG